MSVETTPEVALWPEFGRRLRGWRRRAGLTQAQLGLRVGYHHSLISKLESGVRVPPGGLVEVLDALLGAGGDLAGPVREPAPEPDPPQRTLLSVLPGGDAATAPVATRFWPRTLPRDGIGCPLHGPAACPVPDLVTARALLDTVGPLRTPPRLGDDLAHVLTALLVEYTRLSLESSSQAVLGSVEWLLHALGRMRADAGARRLAAHFAQVAGRLRLHRGQNALSMAWFGHGLDQADSAGDLAARVTLLGEVSALARLDGDAESALASARAMAAADPTRAWTAAVADVALARAHAITGDRRECLRRLELAEHGLSRLGERDHLEVPWLAGDLGRLRVDSAAGGALRDLAAATGDRATARRAVAATEGSLALLPERMRPAFLLLTLRLADSHACAGEPDAAIAIAGPVAQEAAGAGRRTITAELSGLRTRLDAAFGGVSELCEFTALTRELRH